VIYTDKCSEAGCGRPFKVTAQNVYIGLETNGTFRGWTRCPSCVRKQPYRPTATKEVFVEGVGLVRRAPRKNALTPVQNPHAAAHGWGTLGDQASIKETLEKIKKGG
jgi:hypothetical protein